MQKDTDKNKDKETEEETLSEEQLEVLEARGMAGLIDAFCLELHTQEEREAFFSALMRDIAETTLLKLFARLDAPDRAVYAKLFEKLTDKPDDVATQEVVISFLSEKAPDLAELVQEEFVLLMSQYDRTLAQTQKEAHTN